MEMPRSDSRMAQASLNRQGRTSEGAGETDGSLTLWRDGDIMAVRLILSRGQEGKIDMGYSPHIRNFRMPGVDQRQITAEQVAYFSVIEMPYRLRLGRYFRCSLDPLDGIEIVAFNRVSLPKVGKAHVGNIPIVKDHHLLNTRLVVIQNTDVVGAKEVGLIHHSEHFPLTTQATRLLREQPGPQLISMPDQRPLFAIRRFIELYHVHCPPVYVDDMVRPIGLHDFFTEGIVYGFCLRPSGTCLPDSFLKVLLRSENPRQEEMDLGALMLRDAPLGQRRRFIQSLKSGKQSSLSEQMLLLCHSFQAQHNMEMAVITAVAGLEAAFFVFAHKRLEHKLGIITDEFLREQGASTLIKVLPRLYFADQNLPTADAFKLVQQAITARNQIMHGSNRLLDGSGKPKYLNRGHLGTAIEECKNLTLAFGRESNRKTE